MEDYINDIQEMRGDSEILKAKNLEKKLQICHNEKEINDREEDEEEKIMSGEKKKKT